MDDFPEILAFGKFEEDMDMVWHEHECAQGIAGTIKVFQCLLNNFRNLQFRQDAAASPLVQKGIQTVGEQIVKLLLVLIRERLSACGEPGFGFQFQIPHQICGQAVGQPPGEEIVFLSLLPMREVAFADC